MKIKSFRIHDCEEAHKNNSLTKSKKAQIMGMPFVMIFSLILIAATIYAGVIVIKGFLENADRIKVANFANTFKYDVNTLWQATAASRSFSYDLPSKVEKACFVDLSKPTESGSKNLTADFKRIPNAAGNNLFLTPTSFFLGLQVPSSYNIECGETVRVDCLDLTGLPNPYCIPVEKGVLKIELEKEGKIVKVVRE